jgi:bacterioferritin (cytochrome b1)
MKLLPILLTVLLLLTSCASDGVNGQKSRAEEQSRQRITQVDKSLGTNVAAKMDMIAELAYGTDFVLGKVNEPPKEVTVARDINKRIVSLSGSPNIERMKEMEKMIEDLTSTLATTRVEGMVALNQKDTEITALQDETRILLGAKEGEIGKYMARAQEAAMAADTFKAELKDYQGWLGLKAVFKGLWQFAKSSMWILLTIGILFFVLRLAANANPVCGAIFSVFETIVSWFINAIRIVAPKAVAMAGHVTKETYQASQSLLVKIVDQIQLLKVLEAKSARDVTVRELLEELSKTLDSKEKAQIDEIKKALNY